MSVGRVLSFVVLREKLKYTNATGLVYFHRKASRSFHSVTWDCWVSSSRSAQLSCFAASQCVKQVWHMNAVHWVSSASETEAAVEPSASVCDAAATS